MLRVIAIDGPAASGKSTTARAVAERLGWIHVDSGALYRAATIAALDHLREDQRSGLRIRGLTSALPVRFVREGDAFHAEVSGVNVDDAIRSPRVTAVVSQIASLPEVRDWVTSILRSCVTGLETGAVVDGRDIGTVVFPDAPVKIFVTASPAVRAQRRLSQQREVIDPQELARETARLETRDRQDAERSLAPLRRAANQVVLDTSDLGFDEQVERVVTLARKVFPE